MGKTIRKIVEEVRKIIAIGMDALNQALLVEMCTEFGKLDLRAMFYSVAMAFLLWLVSIFTNTEMNLWLFAVPFIIIILSMILLYRWLKVKYVRISQENEETSQ